MLRKLSILSTVVLLMTSCAPQRVSMRIPAQTPSATPQSIQTEQEAQEPARQDQSTPLTEQNLVKQLSQKGIGDRLVLKDIALNNTKMMILYNQPGSPISFASVDDPFFPQDFRAVSLTLASPEALLTESGRDNPALMEVYRVYLKNAILLVKEFSSDDIPTSPLGQKPVRPIAPGSIHRILGELKIGNYTLLNEGDKYNRLTFTISREGYYVYLRGIGKIKSEGKADIELGR